MGADPQPAADRGAPRGRVGPRLPWLSIGVQILSLILVFFWNRIFIVIHSGEAGVLWNRFAGTQVGRVYGEGLHIVSPLDRMTVYEVRTQVALQPLDVLSIDGLTLHLDLAIRYRPEVDLLGMLQARIGPDYLVRVVIPQTESVLRKTLGKATALQIYADENGLLTRALSRAREEAGGNFVELEDIMVRRIRLPETVRTAIEDKIAQQQLLQSYRFRLRTAEQEAERQRIEAGGVRDYQRIVGETLTDRLLTYQGIAATRQIAESQNPKTVVVGAGETSVPIIVGAEGMRALGRSAVPGP
jgi:prohibitin 1